MRVLIIEDEKLTANDLVSSIQEVRPHFTVIKILTSVKSAISFLKTKPAIDLVFSDIQLTDGLSFEIFKAIEIGHVITSQIALFPHSFIKMK